MVYTCFSCKWRSDKLPRRSYHKFPSNEQLKQKWLDILGKSNMSIGTRTSLCALHFEEDCFRYGLVNGRRILKDGSLPTLHLINSKARNESNDLVDEVKLLESPIESSFDTRYSTTDNVQMRDPTSECNINSHFMKPPTSNVENNFVKASMENSFNESSRKRIWPKHFEENCVKKTLDVMPLKDNVVPTAFPFISSSIKVEAIEPKTEPTENTTDLQESDPLYMQQYQTMSMNGDSSIHPEESPNFVSSSIKVEVKLEPKTEPTENTTDLQESDPLYMQQYQTMSMNGDSSIHPEESPNFISSSIKVEAIEPKTEPTENTTDLQESDPLYMQQYQTMGMDGDLSINSEESYNVSMQKMYGQVKLQQKKIKTLSQKYRRMKQRLLNYKNIIDELKKQNSSA